MRGGHWKASEVGTEWGGRVVKEMEWREATEMGFGDGREKMKGEEKKERRIAEKERGMRTTRGARKAEKEGRSRTERQGEWTDRGRKESKRVMVMRGR